MVPTCDVNPLKPLGVGFCCFVIIPKNIKRVRLGVKLCLDLRFVYVVDWKFGGIVKAPWLGERGTR